VTPGEIKAFSGRHSAAEAAQELRKVISQSTGDARSGAKGIADTAEPALTPAKRLMQPAVGRVRQVNLSYRARPSIVLFQVHLLVDPAKRPPCRSWRCW
jgi:hypothetical protein